MATGIITGNITDLSGTDLSGITVTARLRPGGGFRTSGGGSLAHLESTTTDASGDYSLTLERNADISPSGSWYEIEEAVPDAYGGPRIFTVSVTAGTHTAYSSLVTPTTGSGFTNYISQSAADARYAPIAGTVANSYLNVKEAPYSAVGDFSTDDSTAIQQALDATNKWVYVPPGTYGLSTGLNLNTGQRLVLAPGAKLKLQAGAADKSVLKVDGKTDVVIEGGELDGNRANTANGRNLGVHITGASARVLVRGVYAHGFTSTNSAGGSKGDGFYIGNSNGGATQPTDITLENCISNDNVRQGLSITGGIGVAVLGGAYKNTTGTNPGLGIDVEPDSSSDTCRDIRIIGVNIEGNTGGGITFTTACDDGEYVVDGCTLRNNLVNSIMFRGTRGTITNNHVYFPTGAGGIVLDMAIRATVANNIIDGGGGSNVGMALVDLIIAKVSGNQFYDCATSGMRCNQTAGNGSDLATMKGLHISDNLWVDCGTGGAGSRMASIQAEASKSIGSLVFTGNAFIDTRGGSAVDYGYFVDEGAGTITYVHSGNQHIGCGVRLIDDNVVTDQISRGLNLGAIAGDPATLTDGDLWHNTTSDTIKVRLNGSTVTVQTA